MPVQTALAASVSFVSRGDIISASEGGTSGASGSGPAPFTLPLERPAQAHVKTLVHRNSKELTGARTRSLASSRCAKAELTCGRVNKRAHAQDLTFSQNPILASISDITVALVETAPSGWAPLSAVTELRSTAAEAQQ